MLQLISGKLHACGMSFALPDRFYIDTDPEFPYEHGLCCYSPDKKIYFRIYADCLCQDVRAEMETLFEPGSGMYQTSEITPLVLNGLAGFEVTFQSSEHDYYEAHLQLPGGSAAVFVSCCEQGLVTDIKQHPDVQSVLRSISAD